jgi:hypothetical protein
LSKLIVVILSILVLVQPMARLGILASFQLNKARIAKTQCEKRLNAANTCQGKCQLRKQLKEISEAEKKANTEQASSVEKQISPKAIQIPQIAFTEKGNPVHFDAYNARFSGCFLCDVFHPPTA